MEATIHRAGVRASVLVVSEESAMTWDVPSPNHRTSINLRSSRRSNKKGKPSLGIRRPNPR
jgi:hypothetical protein